MITVDKTIEILVDEAYELLFDEICERDDDLYDLVVEYKSSTTGKTIRRSWKERDDRLREENVG